MLITGNVDTALWAAMRDGSGGCECFDGCCYKVSARVESLPEHSAICKFAISPRTRPRAALGRKEGPPTTHQETKYAHFSLVSSWLRLCINITYMQLNLSNRNR